MNMQNVNINIIKLWCKFLKSLWMALGLSTGGDNRATPNRSALWQVWGCVRNDNSFITTTRPASIKRCIPNEDTLNTGGKKSVSWIQELVINVYTCFFQRMGLILRQPFKDCWKAVPHPVRRYAAKFWPFPRTWQFLPSGSARGQERSQRQEPASGEESCWEDNDVVFFSVNIQIPLKRSSSVTLWLTISPFQSGFCQKLI